MNFEWQLLLTHSFSFLITLWILKRFAWGPLLDLIDERREKIVGEFETIERDKEKAEAINLGHDPKQQVLWNMVKFPPWGNYPVIKRVQTHTILSIPSIN